MTSLTLASRQILSLLPRKRRQGTTRFQHRNISHSDRAYQPRLSLWSHFGVLCLVYKEHNTVNWETIFTFSLLLYFIFIHFVINNLQLHEEHYVY